MACRQALHRAGGQRGGILDVLSLIKGADEQLPSGVIGRIDARQVVGGDEHIDRCRTVTGCVYGLCRCGCIAVLQGCFPCAGINVARSRFCVGRRPGRIALTPGNQVRIIRRERVAADHLALCGAAHHGCHVQAWCEALELGHPVVHQRRGAHDQARPDFAGLVGTGHQQADELDRFT